VHAAREQYLATRQCHATGAVMRLGGRRRPNPPSVEEPGRQTTSPSKICRIKSHNGQTRLR
jgi:hypothetical protein